MSVEFTQLEASAEAYLPFISSEIGPEMGQASISRVDFSLGATNKELKCAVLGLLGQTPRTKSDISRELADLGAADVAGLRDAHVFHTIDRFSDSVVEHDGKFVKLTPFGETLQAVAGHQFSLSRRQNVPLVGVWGNKRERRTGHHTSSDTKPTHLVRGFIMAQLGLVDEDVALADLRRTVDAHGIPWGVLSRNVRSLENFGHIESSKNKDGKKVIAPKPVIPAIVPDMAEIVTGTYEQSEAFLEAGKAALNETLNARSVLAHLVRRSILSGNKRDHVETLRGFEAQIYEVICDDGPMGTRAIHEKFEDEHEFEWFSILVSRVAAMVPGCRFEVVANGDRGSKIWGAKPERKLSSYKLA